MQGLLTSFDRVQEWKNRLRSSLHPLLFAAVYKASAWLADGLGVDAGGRAEMLIAGPKVGQAVVAAIGDLYTWKLGQTVYGPESRSAAATVSVL